jgi:hypothetical protein
MHNEIEFLLVVKLNAFENTEETNFSQNSKWLTFRISKMKEGFHYDIEKNYYKNFETDIAKD